MYKLKNIYQLQVPGEFPSAPAASAAPSVDVDGVKIVNADCADLLASLPDNSVDLIATDPPYFRVKSDSWDNQWSDKAAFFSWLDGVLEQMERVLKPTGSLYLFCSPYLSSETEALIDRRFKVLNHIVWRKPSGIFKRCRKESLTKFFPQTERIIFAESRKKKPFIFEPVRAHIADAVKAAGVTSKEINAATGVQMSSHWLGASQFSLPSEQHYKVLQGLAPALKPYAEIRAEYVALRESGKASGRYFSVTKDVPYTDVWDFAPVQYYEGKHPCEKPSAMMEHIVATSSKRGDLVLDAFVGSASTAIAANKLGRRFIGSEMGKDEFAAAVVRVQLAVAGKA